MGILKSITLKNDISVFQSIAKNMSRAELLRQKAAQLIKPDHHVLDDDVTTGALQYKKWPDAVAVVVDKKSGEGFVRIVGGGKVTTISTSSVLLPGEDEFILEYLAEKQSCMLHGESMVIFVKSTAGTSGSEGRITSAGPSDPEDGTHT